MVKSFNNSKYLTTLKTGCTISVHEDIGAVIDDPGSYKDYIEDAMVVGILSISTYKIKVHQMPG